MSAARSRTHPAPLMGAQLVFNVGFYAVVPFIAVVLSEDFALGGSAVGLVLGIRTFAQQGLFLIGGTLADRFGARAIILTGCAVRAAGFSALAAAVHPDMTSLPLFIAGTVLTGFGGALFSPALNTLVAAAELTRGPSSRGRRKPTLFAVLTVAGETGAGIGPVLGAALLGWGFATVAITGTALFCAVGLALSRLLPAGGRSVRSVRADRPAGAGASARIGRRPRCRRSSLGDRRFIAFAALHAVELLAYNQLYLGLPVELRRAGSTTEALAGLFVVVSVMTISLQLPLAAFARRIGSARALALGYACLSAGFAVMALSAPFPAPDGWELAPAVGTVVLLVLGHLLAGPTALDLVPDLAGSARLGSYYGLLATCGGIAVLLGNTVIGSLYEHAGTPQPAASAPWLVLCVLPLIAAVAVPRLLRHTRPGQPAGEPLAGHGAQPSSASPALV